MDLSLFPFSKKKEAVAIDIGSSSIKLAEMRPTKKGWELLKLGIKELPPEAIVDGSIIDSLTVANTIKELIKEQGVKVKDAVSALTGHSVIIKKVGFPAATEEELSESIQWEAEQYIPFPVAEVNIDFQILGADTEGRGQMDVMLVAVKKDVISEYTNVLKEAGLNPAVVDVDVFALENMMETNYPGVVGETVAVLNVGASITSLGVISGGITVFTRSIPMGGNQFTEEIQRHLGVSFKEADGLKTGKTKGDASTLGPVLDSVSSNLAMDIRRSMDFFLGGSQGVYINKIYVSGGGSRTPGLLPILQEKTSIPVEPIDPFKNLELKKSFDGERLKELAPFFGVAIGLATRRFGDR